MDLRKYDSITNAEKGVELILSSDQAGKSTAGIVLFGADSSAHRQIERELVRRNSERKSLITPEIIEDQVFEKLVACTKSWHGLEEGGKALEYSPAAADKLYRSYPELSELVAKFIFNRANFFPTALTTS